MEILTIDIETIPHQSLPEECMPVFDPSEVKTGNAGPEKVQEKINKKRAEFDKTNNKRMSLDPTLCHVCTFAGVIYDTVKDEIKDKKSFQVKDNLDEEYECVHAAWNFIRQCRSKKTPLVTFNGIGFDIPVLIFRAMALDVPIPETKYFMKKYESKDHYDLMQVLARWDKSKWKSFDFYLKLFGFEGKPDDFNGSKVYGAWQAGEYDKIQRYCEGDALQLAELFQRVEAWVI